MNYFLDALKNKYAQFSGRARRNEFWMFVLFFYITLFVVSFIGRMINFPSIVGLVWLALIVPYISVFVRRMHDVDKDWWFFLIPIYNIILACTEGTKGSNEYGPDPKGATDTFNTPPSTY